MRGTRKTRKKTRKVFGGDTNVLSLDNLLNNKNKNLYPIEENEHINIDIAVCKDKKDKTQTHYKIFKIEKTENDSAIPSDNKDRKNLPLTSGYTLDLQLNDIINSNINNFNTKHIRVMLVLYDNEGSKELRIFKVTAIKKIKSSISDQCTRGMHVYTKKNNTNIVKIQESVKIPTDTTKKSETEEESEPEEESGSNTEEDVETLAVIESINQSITTIISKLNDIQANDRSKYTKKITEIKSVHQHLLNTINKNKEKLETSTWYTDAKLKHPTYTIDNIQKVLKNYQDRLNHVGFGETFKLKKPNFMDKVSDGIFIFINLKNYFINDLDAILDDLGNGLKGTVDNTIYNYLENKHVGGRVTHKNKRKLKRQKRRYTKRANRK